MFENIPAELRAIPQWVAAGPDKIPLNPRTGRRADASDPSTGGTFAEAVHAGMKHVGFILSASDPYTIIDLDDPYKRPDGTMIAAGDPDHAKAEEIAARHRTILNRFETFAELSQSGRGAHVIMKGSTARGMRRDKVEVYSSDRYMIFTGRALNHYPIADCQSLLNQLISQMGPLVTPAGELEEEEPTREDSAIWKLAAFAANGEKFQKLYHGEWQALGYQSQSEADKAMLSMLAFYTRSNSQVRRMFRQTQLGKRSKATRNDVYTDRTLAKIRANEPPLIDISAVLHQAELPGIEAPAPSIVATNDPMAFPPGLVGEIASYILASAIRPVREVALAAAIALCAGIAGRAYNISGTGLNQYVILIAKTGRGKEGAATGIDALISALKPTVPMAGEFMGPAAFASGPALVRTLDKQPCFVSVLGEVGLTLQQICDPRAPGPLVMLKKVLLDLYAKSGPSKVLRSSVYSDSDKNTKLIQSPNVTILGESTPETFFGGLDAAHVSEGLIPRFLVIQHDGPRPAPNPNAFFPPDDGLLQRLGELASVAINCGMNNTCAPVQIDGEAQRIFDTFNAEADGRINSPNMDAEIELWNRAHLKALKLGALVAVGISPHGPNITGAIAKWACDLIRYEVHGVIKRFQSGDVGQGEAKQESEIRRLFEHFQSLSAPQKIKHRLPEPLLDSKACTGGFLTIYSRRLACFKGDKRGASRALQETLYDMVRREVLELVPPGQLLAEYKTRAAIYYPGPAW